MRGGKEEEGKVEEKRGYKGSARMEREDGRKDGKEGGDQRRGRRGRGRKRKRLKG